MATSRNLEERLQRLEDIEAIRQLKSRYSHYANVGEGSGSPEKFAALFTEDATFDLSDKPRVGRASIVDHLRHIQRLGYIGLHFSLNPRINVEGDRARGKWDLCFPVFVPGKSEALVVCGFYEDELRRTSEGWRFSRVKYRVSPRFSITPM